MRMLAEAAAYAFPLTLRTTTCLRERAVFEKPCLRAFLPVDRPFCTTGPYVGTILSS